LTEKATRALDLLQAVADSPEPAGMAALGAQLGLDKSTASRLLRYLHGHGYLTRDPNSRRYEVGPKLMVLAATTLRHYNLRSVAEPTLVELRDATGETIGLHIRVGSERLCIAGAESTHVIRRVVPLGERAPLYLGPSSKAILAQLSDGEIDAILVAAGDPVDRGALFKQLKFVRDNGYLAVVSDRTPGVAGLSVPISSGSTVLGSITASGPVERWTVKRMKEFAPRFVSASRLISSRVR
jgi:DNA-binding IclR family transcriptional regulator